MLKTNKRLGSARNLTSDLELQKSKEAYEEKFGRKRRNKRLLSRKLTLKISKTSNLFTFT
jgi:hypothetical protein